MKYNPKEYWEARGKVYGKTMKDISPYLPNLYAQAKDAKSIIDIGSGWGRVLMYFKTQGYAGNYQMCDISNTMRYGAYNVTGQMPRWWDGSILPFREKQFDAAILVFVLLHSPEPVKILLEAKRVSNYVLVLDAIIENDTRVANHCFRHNWARIFADCGLSINALNMYKGCVLWRLGDVS